MVIPLMAHFAWTTASSATATQTISQDAVREQTTVLRGTAPQGAGGGYSQHEASDESSEEERVVIHAPKMGAGSQMTPIIASPPTSESINACRVWAAKLKVG